MGLADRRSFLAAAGLSAGSLVLPDTLFAYVGPIPKPTTLFEEMIADPNNREKGQTLIEKLASELYGEKRYDDVDGYYYDPNLNLCMQDYFKREDELAADPEYYRHVQKMLLDQRFFDEAVERMAKWPIFSQVAEGERDSRTREMLSGENGIRMYILADGWEAKEQFRRRNQDNLGRAVKQDHFPGRSSKSKVYLHISNFLPLHISSNRNLSLSIDGNQFYLSLKTKPLEETLRGVIIHEVTHAEDDHRGLVFGNGIVLRPDMVPSFPDEVMNALKESRAYLAELRYLRQFNPGKGKFHPSYLIQIFYTASNFIQWRAALKSPSLTPFEQTIKDLQLAEIEKAENEVSVTMNLLNKRVEDISKALDAQPRTYK